MSRVLAWAGDVPSDGQGPPRAAPRTRAPNRAQALHSRALRECGQTPPLPIPPLPHPCPAHHPTSPTTTIPPATWTKLNCPPPAPFVLPSPPLVFARRGQGAGGLPRRAASLLRGAWRGTAARPQKVEQTGWPRPSRRQGSRAAARPQVPATRSGSYPTPRLPFAARRRSSSSSVTWPTHSSSTCTSRRSRCLRTSSLGSPPPPSRRRCHPETSPMGPVQPLYVLG